MTHYSTRCPCHFVDSQHLYTTVPYSALVPMCCSRSCWGCPDLAPLKACWSQRVCSCHAAVTPHLPAQLCSFPTTSCCHQCAWGFCNTYWGLDTHLFVSATSERHGQELVVQPGRRMPAEYGGTASPFPACNERDEHLSFAGINSREVPHPRSMSPTKASPSLPVEPDPAVTMAWMRVRTPGRQHPPLPPKLYLHHCCYDAALCKTREEQHPAGETELGGGWQGQVGKEDGCGEIRA